jgi:hypothetical protein
MASRDPRLALLDKLLDRYRRGWYTHAEIVGWCLAVTDDAIAENVFRVLPPEVLGYLKQSVCEAPATEQEWAGTRFVNFGGGVIGGEPELDPTPEASLARYRTSIDAFRRVFGRQDYGERQIR